LSKAENHWMKASARHYTELSMSKSNDVTNFSRIAYVDKCKKKHVEVSQQICECTSDAAKCLGVLSKLRLNVHSTIT